MICQRVMPCIILSDFVIAFVPFRKINRHYLKTITTLTFFWFDSKKPIVRLAVISFFIGRLFFCTLTVSAWVVPKCKTRRKQPIDRSPSMIFGFISSNSSHLRSLVTDHNKSSVTLNYAISFPSVQRRLFRIKK